MTPHVFALCVLRKHVSSSYIRIFIKKSLIINFGNVLMESLFPSVSIKVTFKEERSNFSQKNFFR